MVHVFDEQKHKFVQRHYHDVEMRNSKDCPKRLRNQEYVKWIVSQRKASGETKRGTAAEASLFKLSFCG